MSLQFSIDNILSEKIAAPSVESVSASLAPASGSIPSYMRASLAAAAAANYPGANLAACYSYLYPYVSSSSPLYSATGKRGVFELIFLVFMITQ